MDIVFLGSGAFGLPSLEALAGSSHRILHIISQPDRPAGRGKYLTPTPVAAWALAHNIPLTRTEDANTPAVLDALRALRPACLVVIAFGQKLSDALLQTAPHGGINLHSSLLPSYRGAAPINWAVINNEAEAGVSVIEVTPVMDGGNILATASTSIGRAETAGELHDHLAQLGAPFLPAVLDQLAAGTATRTAQDPARAAPRPKLSREMAWIDFMQSAGLVSARIRGMSPWPGIHVDISAPAGDVPGVKILKCQASPDTSTRAPDQCGIVLPDRTIACGTGTLELLLLQPPGKKPMDAKAFANGYGLVPGARLRSTIPVP